MTGAEVREQSLGRRGARRPRILLVQPSIQPPGGGNALAAWFIDALQADYELHLMLWSPPDLSAVNAYYGTRLTAEMMTVHIVPRWWCRATGLLGRWGRVPLQLLVRKLTMRAAAAIEGDMDLVLSASNEVKSGRPALQYVHFPWGYWPRPDAEMRWFHRLPGVLRLYYALAWALFPVSPSEVARNRTLVNSAWTGRHYRQTYGADSEVLFPPIAGTPPAIPWAQRRHAFVALGRIAPLKRLEHSIAVIEAVRAAGHEVGLTIVGSRDDSAYLADLEALRATRPWVALHADLDREGVLRELASHRFGIHSMVGEHFGMAVAEMVLAGCIPFVHADGGPIEIVADDRLSYEHPEQAVAKILRVLEDSRLQDELLQHLSVRGGLFGVERFRREARRIVAELIVETSRPARASAPAARVRPAS